MLALTGDVEVMLIDPPVHEFVEHNPDVRVRVHTVIITLEDLIVPEIIKQFLRSVVDYVVNLMIGVRSVEELVDVGEFRFHYIISLMFGLLSLLRANPEVSLVLFNLHTQDVEQSEVDLVDVESVMLVFAMLASLEDTSTLKQYA